MNYFKYLINGAAAVALTFTVASCGDSNDEPGLGSLTPDWSASDKENVEKITTDEEAKEYLGETAEIVMSKFQPADQKPLIELAADFASDYEDFSIEFNQSAYSNARPRSSRALARFMKEARQAIATGRYLNLSRAAQNVLEIGMFTGVYEPDPSRRMFTRTASSNDVVVRFFHNGVRCEMKVTASSDSWKLDSYKMTEGEVDAIKVPRTITFSLTEGNTTLASGTVKTNWADGKELFCNADVTALNIHVKGEIKATNSTVTTNDALYVDGAEILKATGKVNGNKMVTSSAVEKIFDKEKDYYDDYYYYEFNPQRTAEMFRSAEASAKLMGRVNVVAQAPDSKKFLAIEDTYFYEDEDYDGKRSCQKVCDILNSAAPAKVFLAGNTKATATLKWQPRRYTDSWDMETWWEIDPVLSFADGSTYSIIDYGTADFNSVVSGFNSVVYAYERMINALL